MSAKASAGRPASNSAYYLTKIAVPILVFSYASSAILFASIIIGRLFSRDGWEIIFDSRDIMGYDWLFFLSILVLFLAVRYLIKRNEVLPLRIAMLSTGCLCIFLSIVIFISIYGSSLTADTLRIMGYSIILGGFVAIMSCFIRIGDE